MATTDGVTSPAMAISVAQWQNLGLETGDNHVVTVDYINDRMSKKGKGCMKNFLDGKTHEHIVVYASDMQALSDIFDSHLKDLGKLIGARNTADARIKMSHDRGSFMTFKQQVQSCKKQVLDAFKRRDKPPVRSKTAKEEDDSDAVLGIVSGGDAMGSVGGYGPAGGGVGGADDGKIQPPPPPNEDNVTTTGYKRVYDESPEEKKHIDGLSKVQKRTYYEEAVANDEAMQNKVDSIKGFTSALQTAHSVLCLKEKAVVESNGLVKKAQEKVEGAKSSLEQAEAECKNVCSLAVTINAQAVYAKNDHDLKVAQLNEAMR